MENIWYKHMIMYSVDIELFYDGNGDGIGDFKGLSEKLNYLAGMGINCLWILPFYPSPNRDNGYDVMHYYEVDPKLGTLGEFSDFIDRANSLGIRVIIDLVINHTSNKHPWFVEAEKDPNSPYHDYYVWSEELPEFDKDKLHFVGEENNVWTYSEKAGKYYLHRFYKEQPDLNMANPAVRQEVMRIMGFWLKMGVSGFRVDAAEMLVETYGLENVTKNDLVEFLSEMRNYISVKKGDAILVGEANYRFSEMDTFLEKGNKLHMMFNFHLNQLLFLALARQSSAPLKKAVTALSKFKDNYMFLNFLRHHDELNLGLLTEKEHDSVVDAFAPEENMRIFERGIRRRLAPMLNDDTQRLMLTYSLLFSFPGVPMIRYGDEIGMGENLRLKGRNSVRTVMQWSDRANGGFSSYEGKLFHPVISDGPFGYPKVNVAKAHNDEHSFLNWLERLIAARKQCSNIAEGNVENFESKHSQLFMHGFRRAGQKTLFIHNLSEQTIELEIEDIPMLDLDFHNFFVDPNVKREDDKLIITPFAYLWLKSFAH